jgi:hypothetical protein
LSFSSTQLKPSAAISQTANIWFDPSLATYFHCCNVLRCHTSPHASTGHWSKRQRRTSNVLLFCPFRNLQFLGTVDEEARLAIGKLDVSVIWIRILDPRTAVRHVFCFVYERNRRMAKDENLARPDLLVKRLASVECLILRTRLSSETPLYAAAASQNVLDGSGLGLGRPCMFVAKVWERMPSEYIAACMACVA